MDCCYGEYGELLNFAAQLGAKAFTCSLAFSLALILFSLFIFLLINLFILSFYCFQETEFGNYWICQDMATNCLDKK